MSHDMSSSASSESVTKAVACLPLQYVVTRSPVSLKKHGAWGSRRAVSSPQLRLANGHPSLLLLEPTLLYAGPVKIHGPVTQGSTDGSSFLRREVNQTTTFRTFLLNYNLRYIKSRRKLRASSSEWYYGKTLTVTHHLKKVRALRAAKYGQASRNSCLKPQFTKHKACLLYTSPSPRD